MTTSRSLTVAGLTLGGLTLAGIAEASTLDEVRARDQLICGVTQGTPGFSAPDDAGNWIGFDVDVCRAISAAIFADPGKVRYVPLSNVERFTALQSGEVDVLSRTTTWTMNRDTALGFNFAPVVFYDGQAFMVRESLGEASALDLDGASVCTSAGSTTELNLADYFNAHSMSYDPVRFDRAEEVLAAYDAGRCDVYTSDFGALAARRLLMNDPTEHEVLPEIISKEPLAPAVRHGDDQWLDIVSWVINALINAEELGVTSDNAAAMRDSASPAIRRLLGVEDSTGEWIGLDADWAYNAISMAGNYGELYERHLGESTPLGLPRGLNALYTDGGILYAPPVR